MRKYFVLMLAALALPALVQADPFYDGPNTGVELTQLACAGAATSAGPTVATVAEQQADVVLTTVSLGTVVLTATDGSAEGESIKLLDFDAGAFTVLGVVVDITSVVSAGCTNTYALSLGTAAAGDDATLNSTEADLAPSTTIDTTGGTDLSNEFNAVLASPAVFDGTATAKDLYLNMGIADASMDANVTNTLTGTIYIWTTKPQDNQ